MIVPCPRCHDPIRFADTLAEDAAVRCPLCQESFLADEVYRDLPPMAEVVDAGSGPGLNPAAISAADPGEDSEPEPWSPWPENGDSMTTANDNDESESDSEPHVEDAVGPAFQVTQSSLPRPSRRNIEPYRPRQKTYLRAIGPILGAIAGIALGLAILAYIGRLNGVGLDWLTRPNASAKARAARLAADAKPSTGTADRTPVRADADDGMAASGEGPAPIAATADPNSDPVERLDSTGSIDDADPPTPGTPVIPASASTSGDTAVEEIGEPPLAATSADPSDAADPVAKALDEAINAIKALDFAGTDAEVRERKRNAFLAILRVGELAEPDQVGLKPLLGALARSEELPSLRNGGARTVITREVDSDGILLVGRLAADGGLDIGGERTIPLSGNVPTSMFEVIVIGKILDDGTVRVAASRAVTP